MIRKLALTLLIAFLATMPAAAAVETFSIDKAHSEVSFQIRHLVTNVRGQFDDYTGVIKMDTEKPESSSVEFTIQATSVNTFNENRDKHLRTADFFDVPNHPTITFKSTSVKKTGDNTYAVTGDFTMRGVTKQITLPVTFTGKMGDPWGNTKAGFETATTLNRKEYGINWNKALDAGGLILGDEVKVAINLETGLEK
ncbi:MAG TPA: YceI family protein [Thermoanaerobaculia bacterium]|nr:YceI family protein [Thermoanaerobaculia bacterium]